MTTGDNVIPAFLKEEDPRMTINMDDPQSEDWRTVRIDCPDCDEPIKVRLRFGTAIIDGVTRDMWIPEMADAYAHGWTHDDK